MNQGDRCRRCKVELRLTYGRGRYFKVNGERVELPHNWSVWQCPKCKRITLSVGELNALVRFMEDGP